MTIKDVEKEEVLSTVRAVVVDKSNKGEPVTVATSVTADGSGSVSISKDGPSGNVSVISIEPSVIQLATVGEVEDPNTRQSALCCGCCCDLVRACIIVNIIFICLAILGLLLSWWGIAWIDRISSGQYDDDSVSPGLAQYMEGSDTYFLINILQLSLGMPFAIIGIIGAAKFNRYLVLATAIWLCIDVILSGVYRNWPGCLIEGLFAYPHFALFVALKNGTITRKDYLRERHCCCDPSGEV